MYALPKISIHFMKLYLSQLNHTQAPPHTAFKKLGRNMRMRVPTHGPGWKPGYLCMFSSAGNMYKHIPP